MVNSQKNTQYSILFIIFISVMVVIGFLNGKISEEITGQSTARLPIVPVQSPVAEEVKAVLSDTDKAISGEVSLDPGALPADRVSTDSSVGKQEDAEVVYELPLREIELPQ